MAEYYNGSDSEEDCVMVIISSDDSDDIHDSSHMMRTRNVSFTKHATRRMIVASGSEESDSHDDDDDDDDDSNGRYIVTRSSGQRSTQVASGARSAASRSSRNLRAKKRVNNSDAAEDRELHRALNKAEVEEEEEEEEYGDDDESDDDSVSEEVSAYRRRQRQSVSPISSSSSLLSSDDDAVGDDRDSASSGMNTSDESSSYIVTFISAKKRSRLARTHSEIEMLRSFSRSFSRSCKLARRLEEMGKRTLDPLDLYNLQHVTDCIPDTEEEQIDTRNSEVAKSEHRSSAQTKEIPANRVKLTQVQSLELQNGPKRSTRKSTKKVYNVHDYEVDQIIGRRRKKEKRLSKGHVDSVDDDDEEEEDPSMVFEYFVKFKNVSHWHNQWVSYVDIHNFAYHKLKAFERIHPIVESEEVDLMDSDWMEVEQVIDCKKSGRSDMVLVKWRSMEYKECTWEPYTDVEDHSNNSRRQLEHFLNIVPYAPITNVSIPIKKYLPLKSQPSRIGNEQLQMHDYQLFGLNWLVGKFYSRTNVILADEMGLGKTIQTIAFCAKLHQDGFEGPYLIIVPLSTLPNWLREFQLWANYLTVVVYTGHHTSRNVIKRNAIFSTSKTRGRNAKLLKANIILTTYEYAVNDLNFFASLNWRAIVVDEGHRLKNLKSKLFLGLKQLKSSFRLLLTGTPLQNNLAELWTLLNFLEPTRFNSLETFNEEFADLNKEETLGKIHELVKPHMLRRLKKDVVKHLPSKTELLVKVKLTSLQRVFYGKVLTKNYAELSKGLGLGKTQYLRAFNNIVMQLRNVCNHPYLFFDSSEQEPDAESEDMAIHYMIMASAKMILLDKMLAKLKSRGHRVLIYSQRTRMLDILEDYLTHREYKYLRIDGMTKSVERQESIDKFSRPDSDYFVFILTTRAGGVGINLQAADTVIIYDSDWNPHMDLQAMARVHRIGQTKKVMVYRLACENTIEERMLEVAAQKKLLETIVVKKMSELSDIIKHGVSSIFADDDDDDQRNDMDDKALIVQSSLQTVGFTDAEIDKLLDLRNEADITPEEEQDTNVVDNGSLALSPSSPTSPSSKFISLKVSEYSLPEKFSGISDYSVTDYDGGNEDEDEDFKADNIVADDVDDSEKARDDCDFWKTLLAERVERENALEEERRKRELVRRRKRNRRDLGRKGGPRVSGVTLDNDSDDMDDSNDGNYQGTTDDESTSQNLESSSKKQRVEDDGVPPLREGEGKNLKILGFNSRERDAFIRLLLRFGSGKHTSNEHQFLFEKASKDNSLKNKSYVAFERYCKLVWSHIQEHNTVHSDTNSAASRSANARYFSDGCPVEFNCSELLVRFSILYLINQKVEQYDNSKDEFDIKDVSAGSLSLHKSWNNPQFPWRREHDLKFLKGILKHGYGRWKPIYSDPELDLASTLSVVFENRTRKRGKTPQNVEVISSNDKSAVINVDADDDESSNDQSGEKAGKEDGSVKGTEQHHAPPSPNSATQTKKQQQAFQIKANLFFKKRIKDIEDALEKEYEYNNSSEEHRRKIDQQNKAMNAKASHRQLTLDVSATSASSSKVSSSIEDASTGTDDSTSTSVHPIPYSWTGKLIVKPSNGAERHICYLAAYYIGPQDTSGRARLLLEHWPHDIVICKDLERMQDLASFERVFKDNAESVCIWMPIFEMHPTRSSDMSAKRREYIFGLLLQKMIEKCSCKLIPLDNDKVLMLFPARLCESLKPYHQENDLPTLASIVLPSSQLHDLDAK